MIIIEYICYGRYVTFASTNSEVVAIEIISDLERRFDWQFRYRHVPMTVSTVDEFNSFLHHAKTSAEITTPPFFQEEREGWNNYQKEG